jgi:deoxyribonuclease V
MLHRWDLAIPEAKQLQIDLRQRLVLTWDGREVSTVGGVDVGLRGTIARAAIVVLHYPELTPLTAATADVPLAFPYVPGLLSFREAPAVLAAWDKLATKPDLVLFDGQGIAHPRGIGIAAHLGLWFMRPAVGVAKSRLYGRHAEPGLDRGEWVPLQDEDEPERVIGAVLRTRTAVRPVYVSPGHLIDLPQSIHFVLTCTAKYRLPEPTRWAHRVAGGATLPGGAG